MTRYLWFDRGWSPFGPILFYLSDGYSKLWPMAALGQKRSFSYIARNDRYWEQSGHHCEGMGGPHLAEAAKCGHLTYQTLDQTFIGLFNWDRTCSHKQMESSLLKKLVSEVRRYQNKDFLKAAMAVCALAANADGEVSIAERYSIDHAIANEPALQEFDGAKAIGLLDGYIYALRQEGASANEILSNKVERMAGDHKRSRTLMRVAYLIITADREIQDGEMDEFGRLCGLLDLEPRQVWAEISAGTPQAGA